MIQSAAVPQSSFLFQASDGLVARAFRRASRTILTVFIPLVCRTPKASSTNMFGISFLGGLT